MSKLNNHTLSMEEFFRPIPLLALMLMAVNDHFLRIHWPNFITGKLSDFAVVLYFPPLLTSCLNLFLYLWYKATYKFAWAKPCFSLTPKKVLWANAITAFILVSINTSYYARDFYLFILEKIDIFNLCHYRYSVDPTDIIALCVMPIAILDSFAVISKNQKEEKI